MAVVSDQQAGAHLATAAEPALPQAHRAQVLVAPNFLLLGDPKQVGCLMDWRLSRQSTS